MQHFYPAWKKVAECVYSTDEFPRPSMLKNDTYKESLNPYDYDTVDGFNHECQEKDGDGVTGACFERFATKELLSTLYHL